MTDTQAPDLDHWGGSTGGSTTEARKPPKQADYIAWIRYGLSERGDYEPIWRKCRAYYANRQEAVEELESTGGRVALVNRIKSTVDAIFPASTLRNPKVLVRPRHPAHADSAGLAETMVNAWWRLYNARTPFRLAFLDCLQIGHGWVKTTWEHTEYNDGEAVVVEESRPRFMVPDPFDMVIDPESTGMHDARWVAQRSFESLPAVWRNPNYLAATRRKVKSSMLKAADGDDDGRLDDSQESDAPDTRLMRAEIWEMWDIERELFCVFASGTDGWLVEPRPFPYENGQPFERMDCYAARGFLYPIGEIEPLLYLQDELNYTRTDQLEHRSRMGSKVLVEAQALTDELREGLASRDPITAVPVRSTNLNPSEAVSPMAMPSVPPDYYAMSDVISADMDEVSGVSEYRRGSLPAGRHSATEAAIVADSQAIRTAEKSSIVETAAANVARRIVELARQLLTVAGHVPDESSEDGFVLVSRDAIDGLFEYEVEIGSMAPRDDIAVRQEALQLWGSFASLAGVPLNAEGEMIDVAALARLVLQRHGVQDPDEYIVAAEGGGAGALAPSQMLAEQALPPEAAPTAAPTGAGLAG